MAKKNYDEIYRKMDRGEIKGKGRRSGSKASQKRYEGLYDEMIHDDPDQQMLREQQKKIIEKKNTIFLVIDWGERKVRAVRKVLEDARDIRESFESDDVSIIKVVVRK